MSQADVFLYGLQISCIPGGKFLVELFSKQRHEPAFQLQLTEINENWPGLAMMGFDDVTPSFLWRTINGRFEVSRLLTGAQNGTALPQHNAADLRGRAIVEHACSSSALANCFDIQDERYSAGILWWSYLDN